MIKTLKQLIEFRGYKDIAYEVIQEDSTMRNMFRTCLEKNIIDMEFIRNNKDVISPYWLDFEKFILEGDEIFEIYTLEEIQSYGWLISSKTLSDELVKTFNNDTFIRIIKKGILEETHIVPMILTQYLSVESIAVLSEMYKDSTKIINAIKCSQIN